MKSALLEKGFKEEKDRDHKYYFLYYNGKKTSVFTKISHGEREIHDQNCSRMARQMRLTTPQFNNFVDCPLKLPQYLEILVQGKHIARRSLYVDKTTKKEVVAHCTACKAQFIGFSQVIVEKEFQQHQCKTS